MELSQFLHSFSLHLESTPLEEEILSSNILLYADVVALRDTFRTSLHSGVDNSNSFEVRNKILMNTVSPTDGWI